MIWGVNVGPMLGLKNRHLLNIVILSLSGLTLFGLEFAAIEFLLLLEVTWGFKSGYFNLNRMVIQRARDRYKLHVGWLRIVLPVIGVMVWFVLAHCAHHAFQLVDAIQLIVVVSLCAAWAHLPVAACDLVKVFISKPVLQPGVFAAYPILSNLASPRSIPVLLPPPRFAAAITAQRGYLSF